MPLVLHPFARLLPSFLFRGVKSALALVRARLFSVVPLFLAFMPVSRAWECACRKYASLSLCIRSMRLCRPVCPLSIAVVPPC